MKRVDMKNEDALRKDVRKIQLNILKKLDEVCENNGLKYYLAFGTCLELCAIRDLFRGMMI